VGGGLLHSRTLALTTVATNDFVSTTLYIVTVSRSHPVLPGVLSNFLRLRLIYSFAVLPASNSVFVCVATFIIATRFRGVKQIGFYPNILEQQLVSWCFNFHCCACDVILFHLSASDWCASSAWTLTFWFRAVWLRNLAPTLGHPFGCFFYETVLAISFLGLGVLALPFHPGQNSCGFSFTKESSLIDALTHPSLDRDDISPPLQLKREERFILVVFTCFSCFCKLEFTCTRSGVA
jgi:hypothetical protein